MLFLQVCNVQYIISSEKPVFYIIYFKYITLRKNVDFTVYARLQLNYVVTIIIVNNVPFPTLWIIKLYYLKYRVMNKDGTLNNL